MLFSLLLCYGCLCFCFFWGVLLQHKLGVKSNEVGVGVWLYTHVVFDRCFGMFWGMELSTVCS